MKKLCNFVCLFACLEIFVPLENFSLPWRRHHYRWKAGNFELCSELMVIEKWGFISVPHLLWHGASVCYCHLTHTCCRAFSSGTVTTCFIRLRSVDAGNRTPHFSRARQTLLLTAPVPRNGFCWYKPSALKWKWKKKSSTVNEMFQIERNNSFYLS